MLFRSLVSHDRRFLDHVVTSTIVFEGEARVAEYVGGYEDWLRQRPTRTQPDEPEARQPVVEPRPSTPGPASPARRKATNKEQREREELPARIDALEREQRQLEAATAAPDFYRRPKTEIESMLARLAALPDELLAAYARWSELDELR